ncbi:MAG: hypothetical protein R2734_02825 [Nocardioides sp.]
MLRAHLHQHRAAGAGASPGRGGGGRAGAVRRRQASVVGLEPSCLAAPRGDAVQLTADLRAAQVAAGCGRWPRC